MPHPPPAGGFLTFHLCRIRRRPAGSALPPAARRGLVRSARPLAAAVVLALTGALAVPQSADAQSVLVSNDGKTDGPDASITNTSPKSQRFMPGSNPGGYSLSSVDVTTANAGTFSMKLCGVTDITPTSDCMDLGAPSGSAEGTRSFTARAGTVLEASTTYSLLMTNDGDSVRLKTTTSDAEDAGHISGWSITDAFEYEQGSAGSRT